MGWNKKLWEELNFIQEGINKKSEIHTFHSHPLSPADTTFYLLILKQMHRSMLSALCKLSLTLTQVIMAIFTDKGTNIQQV